MIEMEEEKKYYISEEKLEQLKKELEYCLNERKKSLMESLRLAREEGDERECDAFRLALDLIHDNEERTAEIKEILKNHIIVKDRNNNKVSIGNIVTVEIGDQKKVLQICDSIEADPLNGKISVDSLIGKALLDMRIGERKEAKLNNYKVVSIKIIKIS